MIKTAYQIGLQTALQEENFDQLLKEAQELGLDLEKIAIPGMGALKGLWGGAKTFGKNLAGGVKGLYQGATKAPGTSGAQLSLFNNAGQAAAKGATPGFMSRMKGAWGALTPGQQQAMKLTGAGAGGMTLGGMMSGGGQQQPPPQQPWY